MSFWSSLDWGSFVGGVIGAGGEFGAAWFVYSRENRRKDLSLQLRTIHNIRRAIEKGVLELQGTQNEDFVTMYNTLDIQLLQPIEEYMPDAAETSEDIYALILALNVSITRYLDQRIPNDTWTDKKFLASESSITLSNEVREASVCKYLTALKSLQKILDRYPWHQR